jgi:hypothetical protein
MIAAALVFSGCQFLVCACIAVFLRFVIARKEAQLRKELRELARALIEAPDDKTPSPLAVMIDQGATLLAARLMQQIKAMLAGVESGLSKNEQLELMEGAANGSPLVGMLAGMLPKRIRNGLMRNPQMIGALSNLFNRQNGGGGTSDSPPPRKHRD